MKILIASSEAVPYVKTGGLADVVGALCREYQQTKKEAHIILPLYRQIKKTQSTLNDSGVTISVPVGKRVVKGRIFTDQAKTYFIQCDEFFDRVELYGTPLGDYADNASRFIFFSRGILETCRALKFRPDIVHCNDWQTGLLPLYLKTLYKNDKNFQRTATVLTIHNLGYQGIFPASEMLLTNLGWELFHPEGIEFYGKINFLKAGILTADLLTTVSKTYAKEILEKAFGFGLEGVLRNRIKDLYGIINGIDYSEWNPETDRFIPSNYNFKDISGKALCKKDLIKSVFVNLNGGITSVPLLGIVGRLSMQKGLDLVLRSVDQIVSSGAMIVILGKGDDELQRKFLEIGKKYKNKVSVTIGFEEQLAHKIYAGSDFFLMPSRYEPCGLGQLVALRYGTIPITRKTGGFVDVINDYEHLESKGTGFLFTDYTPSALQEAIKRALCVYIQRDKAEQMIKDGMKLDFSWKNSARKYLELYRMAMRKRTLKK